MICRAWGCPNFAMPTNTENPKGLCGRCHEADEDEPVRLKPGPRNGVVSAEAVAKRNATRARHKAEKLARIAEIKAGAA